nr:transposon Ty3-G Gag-Pol polyprotein [Tanacetum cinerariifolium]
MPPKKDNPPLEETMAAMAADISKLLESQTITNENIKATQTQSSSQLDVISKQLAAQYEQTATLISTIAQNHRRTHQLQPPNNISPPHNSSLTAAPALTSETLAIKRLSPSEMQQRRVDGLCFNCPEKYSPGHKCNPPKFLLLQTGHEPPLDLRVQSSNNVSLEDKAHLHAESIDTWATSKSGKSSFL